VAALGHGSNVDGIENLIEFFRFGWTDIDDLPFLKSKQKTLRIISTLLFSQDIVRVVFYDLQNKIESNENWDENDESIIEIRFWGTKCERDFKSTLINTSSCEANFFSRKKRLKTCKNNIRP
jgi:hypothetical protein